MSFNNNHINDDFSPSSGGDGSELITRHNYEEYFLLYVDNELNAVERKAVEEFVEQNPDLGEELVMLRQSVLKPEKISFSMKAALLQPVSESGTINETNYEEYFVLYADNELTNAEKDLVEQFVYKHPQYQAEFELLQQVKLIPDHAVSYPDKNELYRTEEDHKVVPFAWRKLAVAAVLLLFMGGVVYYAVTRSGDQPAGPVVAKTNQPAAQQPATKTNGASKGTHDIVTAPKADKKVNPVQQQLDAEVKTQTPDVAVVEPKKVQQKRNIDVIPNVTPIEQSAEPKERDLAAKAVKVNVTEPEHENKISVNTTVDERSLAMNTPKSSRPIGESFTPADEDEIYVGPGTINKAPLRGLFRKVTRVLDKATNVEPEERSKGGIRIASFSIARNK